MSQRTYSAGVELSLGMASLRVDLAPIRRTGHSEVGELKFACPEATHKVPTRVEQQYRCSDGHIHQEHELGRMRIVDDETVVAVDPTEVVAVRCGTIEKRSMTLAVHPAAEVEAATVADTTAYRCRLPKGPSAAQRELYAVLLTLAADKTKAIVGTLRIRDSRALYRVVVHRGQLTVVSLVPPEDLEPVDEIDVPKPAAKNLATARKLVDELLEPFDSKAYFHDVEAAMAKLVAGKKHNVAVPVAAPAPTAAPTDLMAALEASLKKSKAKTRKVAKVTPIKKRAARQPARKAG